MIFIATVSAKPLSLWFINKVYSMEIVQAETSDLASFFRYLDQHLAENGVGGHPLFQPVSKVESTLSEKTRDKFSSGVNAGFNDMNWRKLWLAKDGSGRIQGHIDLRHHGHEHSLHRVLLGMGVENSCRRQGLGRKLLEVAGNFCYANRDIDWLDLYVLSENIPARNLYLKCGFSVVGEMLDQYRIDGHSVAELLMTKNMKS